MVNFMNEPELVMPSMKLAIDCIPEGIRIVTAEELFVPKADGTPPFARQLLDEVTAIYPIDEEHQVYYGPAPLDKLAEQNRKAAHPYVFIEQVKPQDRVLRVERQGREYFVGDDEHYYVTVSNNPEVAEEVAARKLTRHETYYSKAVGRVTVLKPRPARVKQTYFPGGMNSITSTSLAQ